MKVIRGGFATLTLPALALPVVALVLVTGCAPAEPPAATFTHGVASGDPLSTSVMLWTRAEPSSMNDDAPVLTLPVDWRVASDDQFQTVVAEGSTTAESESDWTVHVEASSLEPGATYYYDFRVGESRSPIGRTKTFPDGPVESARFAVYSCANFGFGYFAAYRDAAEREGIDAVLHLGDYIYEYGEGEYDDPAAIALGRAPEPPHEILSLDDYRARYAQYRTDPDLKELHRRYPFIVVWDDHESANNSWKDGAENHDPAEGSWLDRRRAAVRAYHEWMPIRRQSPDEVGKIYRSFRYGDLAELIMLDTRLVGRDEQLSYDSDVDVASLDARSAKAFVDEKLGDPSRSILGQEQEQWLREQLSQSKDRVIWQVIGQQLIMAPLRAPDLLALIGEGAKDLPEARRRRLEAMHRYSLPLNLDAWDGYQASRSAFYRDAWQSGGNVVVLTGDSHNAWAFDLIDENEQHQIGVELGTPGVTSPGLERIFPVPPDDLRKALIGANPHLAWANTSERGYMMLDLDHDSLTAQWLFVDDLLDRDARLECQAAWRVSATAEPGMGPLEEVACSL